MKLVLVSIFLPHVTHCLLVIPTQAIVGILHQIYQMGFLQLDQAHIARLSLIALKILFISTRRQIALAHWHLVPSETLDAFHGILEA
jgi:hypothetical protein